MRDLTTDTLNTYEMIKYLRTDPLNTYEIIKDLATDTLNTYEMITYLRTDPLNTYEIVRDLTADPPCSKVIFLVKKMIKHVKNRYQKLKFLKKLTKS